MLAILVYCQAVTVFRILQHALPCAKATVLRLGKPSIKTGNCNSLLRVQPSAIINEIRIVILLPPSKKKA